MKRLIALTILSYFCITSLSWAACVQGNCENGKGTYTWPSGNKQVGDWKGGSQDGQGTKTWANGDKYVGGYENNKQHGKGTYYWPDGRKDAGQWKDGNLNGYAIQYKADGSIYREGIFKDDEFLYEEKRSENTSSSSGNSELDNHKEFCKEIGFTPGTEKFGECVMKLMDED